MNNYPVKKKNEIQKTDSRKTEIAKPLSRQNTFMSYRYSYKSVSSFGGKTHITSKEERFENGRLESHEFEGTMEGDVYCNTVSELQENFVSKMFSFFNTFNPLSFPLLPDQDREDKKR